MLKFSKANAKLKALANVPELKRFLTRKRKVYSFDLLSGWSCPFAEKCLSKVHILKEKKKLLDGEKTEFRCFSASQEVAFPSAYKLRKDNFDALRGLTTEQIVDMIESALPKNAGIVRIHVAGDFFSPSYFRAWLTVASNNPEILFYAYTKSLSYWIKEKNWVDQLDNFVLTASRGGRLDHLIDQHNLRESIVVFSPEEAESLNLEIDHTDEHAAVPEWKNNSFALLIHGIQPAGSAAAAAIKELKEKNVKFSYSGKAVN